MCEANGDRLVIGDIEREGADPLVLQDLPARLVQPTNPPQIQPPIALKVGEVQVKVYFDLCTHSSGDQRAFVHCQNAAHNAEVVGGCRLYRFTKRFASTRHCAAFLIAWAVSAGGESHKQHIASRLVAALVRDCERRLGIGA